MEKRPRKIVCRLQRSIYGLKQPSRSWNTRSNQAIKGYDFDQNIDDPYVYKTIVGKKVVLLILYVADIILIEIDIGVLVMIKVWLVKKNQYEGLQRSALCS